GIRGIAYCGALMELENAGILSSVETMGGTSSGAITACFYSVGYTPTEIYEVIGNTNFGQFNDGKWGIIGGLYRLKNELGYYPGDELLSWLEDHIEAKTGNRNLTFLELSQLAESHTNFKNLVIAATSLNHQRTLYFSTESYPHMRIADAVHASMAVPLYFEPVAIDKHGIVVEKSQVTTEHNLCADGGITANFMIDYFDHFPLNETLGLRIDTAEQIENDQTTGELAYQETGDLSNYIQAFYYIIKETMNRTDLKPEDWERTISIEDCKIGPKVKKLSTDQKQALIEAGKKGVQHYCEKRN
ncbi:MAG: patatin-like phospholipase family protein, partial [Flavobacteriales bacterium]